MKDGLKSKSGANEAAFVDYIINRCQSDKGVAARLRRADNPATEYQSWDVLAAWRIDLEDEQQRLPFATIAAAIARSKVEKNGTSGIGRSIASCYEDGRESKQGQARLRRLLACDSAREACRILRAVFSLIDSRGADKPDYARLLGELRKFHWRQERVKAAWAQDFYRSGGEQ